MTRHTTDLDREFAARGLVRMTTAANRLGVTHEALQHLINQGQLKPTPLTWKSRTLHGIPASQIEGREVVYRNGTVRLVNA